MSQNGLTHFKNLAANAASIGHIVRGKHRITSLTLREKTSTVS